MREVYLVDLATHAWITRPASSIAAKLPDGIPVAPLCSAYPSRGYEFVLMDDGIEVARFEAPWKTLEQHTNGERVLIPFYPERTSGPWALTQLHSGAKAPAAQPPQRRRYRPSRTYPVKRKY